MNVAIVYDGFPWPIRSGDTMRVDQLSRVLQERGHSVVLISTAIPDWGAARRANRIVNHVYFFFPRTIRNYLRLLKRRIDGLLTAAGLPPTEEILQRGFLRAPKLVEATDYWKRCPPGLGRFVTRMALAHSIDVLIVEYIWMHCAIAHLPSSVRTAIDVQDLQYRRAKEFELIGRIFPLEIDKPSEFAIYEEFDAAIAIQHAEANELRSQLSRAKVLTAGVSYYDPVPPNPPPSSDVLFVGGFNEANRHGIRRFLDEVWPRVHARHPDACLQIVGHIGNALIGETLPTGVCVRGYVEVTRPFFESAAVVVNPVWVGTGLKVKTVEAIGHGKPLVTTSVGVEGMLPCPKDACIVEDDPDQMATRLIQLLEHQNLRTGLALRAAKYAHDNLSANNVYGELLEWIEEPGNQ